MESNLSRQSTRSNVVRTAEGRKEVIQSILVSDVYARKTKTPFAFIAMEEIILADGRIE